MKTIALLAGASISLTLAAVPAYAGNCSIEIETLTQVLGGAGASGGVPTAGAMPKAPSTAGTLPASPLATTTESTKAESTKLAEGGAMPKAPSTAGDLPANPLATTTEGTSPPGAGTVPENMSTAAGGDATASLERARELDQAGDETSCMAEVAKAKELIGIK
jgi:hypothetical protein